MYEKININELNYAIKQYRKNIKLVNYIDYDSINYASEELTRNIELKGKPIYIKNYTHEKAIGIVLDFFKSLGNMEWYNSDKNIIFSIDPDIGISIYNFLDVKNPDMVDKNGIKMYSIQSSLAAKVKGFQKGTIKNNIPKANIRISKNDRYSSISNAFEIDKISLENIYTMVHEISHTFDLSNDMGNILKRDLISELLPFCFEKLLNEYLLENNVVNSKIIDSINLNRSGDVLAFARHVYTIFSLIRIQVEDGEITKEGIYRFLIDKKINNDDLVKKSIKEIINVKYNVDDQIKYLIAGLTSERFIKNYKKDKKASIDNLSLYCKSVKEGEVNEETIKLIDYPNDDNKMRETVDMFIKEYKEMKNNDFDFII